MFSFKEDFSSPFEVFISHVTNRSVLVRKLLVF